MSDDEINRVALLYLSSLIKNDNFVNQNSSLAENITNMIQEYSVGGKKFVITVINGMVTLEDINRNENPFGEQIVSVQMRKRVKGGSKSKKNKKSKTKRRKSRKTRRRR